MTHKYTVPNKVGGVAHVLAAARYSIAGLKRLKRETAFGHELLAAVIVLVAFGIAGAAINYFVIAIVLFLITIAVEALNTAIEEIVDLVSPEWSEAAKNAKDLGSLAVMCFLLANALFAFYVLANCMWAT